MNTAENPAKAPRAAYRDHHRLRLTGPSIGRGASMTVLCTGLTARSVGKILRRSEMTTRAFVKMLFNLSGYKLEITCCETGNELYALGGTEVIVKYKDQVAFISSNSEIALEFFTEVLSCGNGCG